MSTSRPRHAGGGRVTPRTRPRSGHSPFSPEPIALPPPAAPPDADGPHLAVIAAAIARPYVKADRDRIASRVTQAVRSLSPAGLVAITEALRTDLDGRFRLLFDRGWMPHDVVRYTELKLDAADVAALEVVLLATIDRHLDVALAPPRWADQIEQLRARVHAMARSRRMAGEVLASDDLALPEATGAVILVRGVTLLQLTLRVTALQHVEPPPREWAAVRAAAGPAPSSASAAITADQIADAARAHGLDAKLLERVRALLAKAEGTSFEEEAAVFTAKAQELMARHGIEDALLASAGAASAEPAIDRVWIDNPYADVKSLLLGEVSRANRCRSVIDSSVGCSTVIGFPGDIDAVTILFTSLLVQGTTFLTSQGSQRTAYGTSTTTSFRRSFWLSYSSRIGQRLREAVAAMVDEVAQERGVVAADDLLPVLADRERQVDDALKEAFPKLSSKRYTASNQAGWAAGKVAADQADLSRATARLGR